MDHTSVFIVIPAFNEAHAIRNVLEDLQTHGYRSLIVVDDGSHDDTASIARPYATVLRHAVNRGMGAALVTGTTWALNHDAQYIVHFDADGQHAASEIERVLSPVCDGSVDIVLGSRYLQENNLPFVKKYLIHKPAIFFQNMSSGMHLTDVHNGFRAMNRHAAKVIRITQDRMAHASEIIHEIKAHQLRYREIPVTISYHEFGQGIFAGLRILKDLMVKTLHE
jgi:polyprenyl-phospho-N-acetylgalactosaminyl synthase